ncbi:MAG: TetR/AcrR family transcriptional regulator [Hydrocarboniphaga sp.]|nr:TetR/AcrR family transcriptional regulator [Hydrocarboniphaga sp.]
MLRSRAALNSALLELIALRPFDQISVRDITAQAGVGYATFFRHHASKEALLERAAADQIRQLVATALAVMDATDTRASCMALCTYVDEHRAIWSALLTSGAQQVMRDEFARVAMEVSSTRANGWIPAEVGVLVTAGSTIEILSWWLRQTEKVPVAQVAKMLDWLVMSPLVLSGSAE